MQGGVISTRVSPIKSKIREFLKVNVGTETAQIILRVNDFMGSIQAGRTSQAERTRLNHTNADVVEQTAENLIGKVSGTERTLLSKSLQEALYYAVRFEPNLDYDEFIARVSHYLHQRGAGSFIKRFLSLFFFNFVRFHTGEILREKASTSDEFEEYLAGLDMVCQQTVTFAWKSFEKTKQPLDLQAAHKLISDIEQRLRGI